ncbi:23409_t:CDS:1, partial [Gigaspora margarita]
FRAARNRTKSAEKMPSKKSKSQKKKLEIDIENVNKKNYEEYKTNLGKESKRKLLKNSKKENIQGDILDH